jgi:hypothetical protein
LIILVSSLDKVAMIRRLKIGRSNCSKSSTTVAKEGRNTQEEIYSLLEDNIECVLNEEG